MKLAHNWRELLVHAWSIWLLYASIFLGACELALPYLNGVLPVSQGIFALIVFVLNIVATVARILHQRNLGGSHEAQY